MGSVVRYVSDAALRAGRLNRPCPACGTAGDVYPIHADVRDENDTGPVSELCLSCIAALPEDDISAWVTESRLFALVAEDTPELTPAECSSRAESIRRELRRTPRLPVFVQDDEWPFCCGDLMEFVGGEDMSLTTIASLGGVSSFRCRTCGRDEEVFQST